MGRYKYKADNTPRAGVVRRTACACARSGLDKRIEYVLNDPEANCRCEDGRHVKKTGVCVAFSSRGSSGLGINA